MSKLYLLLLLSFITFTICDLSCAAPGEDCDLTEHCCGNYVCKDYRCSPKGSKDNKIIWAPDGTKCDWFHHCGHGYNCQSHRCVLRRQKIVDVIADKLEDAYEERKKNKKKGKETNDEKLLPELTDLI